MLRDASQTILDVKTGYITNNQTEEKAILVGVYPMKDSGYVEDLELIINPKGQKPIVQKVPYSGYALSLFLGDFNGDGLDDIMIRGAFGGSGGYGIAAIYTYTENGLVQIFSPEYFQKSYPCFARYLDNYITEVRCPNVNQKYLIDMHERPQVYLNIVYTPTGKVIPDNKPIVSELNTAYPIQTVYNKFYELIVQQRIIGVSNADTLGAIQSMVSLKDNAIQVTQQSLLTFGGHIVQLPEMAETLKE